MKILKKKYLLLAVIIIFLLCFGYYRDFVFVTINAVIKSKELNVAYNIPVSMLFTKNWKIPELIQLKWILTITFMLIYLLITLLTVFLLFNNKKYQWIILATYGLIFCLSGIFMLIGFLFESISWKMYECARYLMGMVQSPIVLMFLVPAFKLSEQESDKNPN